MSVVVTLEVISLCCCGVVKLAKHSWDAFLQLFFINQINHLL